MRRRALGSNNQQELLCAPPTVSAANYACPLAPGVTSVPSCSVSLGTLSYLLRHSRYSIHQQRD